MQPRCAAICSPASRSRPTYSLSVALRDGTQATIRLMGPDDKGKLIAAFAKLDRQTIYARFFSYLKALAEGPLVAAFTIEEDFQRQGLASRLLAALAGIARRHGIERFKAEGLAVNAPMLAVLRRGGLPITQHREGGAIHVTLDLRQAQT